MPSLPGPNMTSARVRWVLATGLVGLNLMVLGASGVFLATSRLQYARQAAVNAQNLAQVLEQDIMGLISKVDVALAALANDVGPRMAQGEPGPLRAQMRKATIPLPELDGLRIADAQGNVTYDQASGPTFNIADRDYFIQLRDDPRDRLLVSKPMRGRIHGRWGLILARRINGPKGAFAGVAFGILPLENLARLFNTLDLGRHGICALRDGTDVGMIARFPETEASGIAVGATRISPQLRRLLNEGRTEGTYEAPSGLDRTPRTWGYRHFGQGRFYLFVGLSRQDYLAEWYREAAYATAFMVLFALLSTLAARGAYLGWRRNQAATNAMRANDEKVRLFFEHQVVGMVILNPDRTFAQVNDKFCQITGHAREELAALGWDDLTHPEDRPRNLELFRQLEAGASEGVVHTQRILARGGAERLVELSLGCVRKADGGIDCLLVMLEDITDYARAEAGRRELEQQLQAAQRMKSLGNLAGGVAHDMNNVLGAILAMASAHLAAREGDDPARRAFETIAEAATRGGAMVKSLLSFARQQPAAEQEVDLNRLLEEDIALLEHTTFGQVTLVRELASDLKPIRGDAGALANVFMNVLVNAVDAMLYQGVITLRTRNLPGDRVEVEIEDTGHGMTPEVLAKAVDPFFTTKGVGKGTGLGLALVYSTVTAHHGQLDLASEPGRGTSVRMRFPAVEPVPPAPPAVLVPRAEAPRAGLDVLLVDDDELILHGTRMLLEVMGHRVVNAGCGEEALDRLREGYRPDVVMLDMHMPGLGATGTLPRLRALCPNLPVLLDTGRADQEVLDLIAAHSKVTLLAKPFSLDELQAQLGRVERT